MVVLKLYLGDTHTAGEMHVHVSDVKPYRAIQELNILAKEFADRFGPVVRPHILPPHLKIPLNKKAGQGPNKILTRDEENKLGEGSEATSIISGSDQINNEVPPPLPPRNPTPSGTSDDSLQDDRPLVLRRTRRNAVKPDRLGF